MGQLWNVPSEGKSAQLSRELIVRLAATQLRRFLRNKNWFQRFLGIILEIISELLTNFLSIDIAHHDESQIVRHVARLVILHHLLLGELIVDFHLTDDRKAIVR